MLVCFLIHSKKFIKSAKFQKIYLAIFLKMDIQKMSNFIYLRE